MYEYVCMCSSTSCCWLLAATSRKGVPPVAFAIRFNVVLRVSLFSYNFILEFESKTKTDKRRLKTAAEYALYFQFAFCSLHSINVHCSFGVFARRRALRDVVRCAMVAFTVGSAWRLLTLLSPALFKKASHHTCVPVLE